MSYGMSIPNVVTAFFESKLKSSWRPPHFCKIILVALLILLYLPKVRQSGGSTVEINPSIALQSARNRVEKRRCSLVAVAAPAVGDYNLDLFAAPYRN